MFVNFGNGGANWHVAPGMLFLMLIFNSGYLSDLLVGIGSLVRTAIPSGL